MVTTKTLETKADEAKKDESTQDVKSDEVKTNDSQKADEAKKDESPVDTKETHADEKKHEEPAAEKPKANAQPTEAEINAAREMLAKREEHDTAELDSSKVATKNRIDMNDTVPRFYPLMEGMHEGTRMKATINEFEYSVPRNKDVQVPKVFAEIFDNIRRGETGQNIPRHLLHDAKAAKYAQENAQFY